MEETIEQKLKSLYNLQKLHTQIDKIRRIRGELPMEVTDLEDEIVGLETRSQKIKLNLDELDNYIVNCKNGIKQATVTIRKYETQLTDVKNNREYEALSKEIEVQGLEIQVFEKRIKEYELAIVDKTKVYEEAVRILEERKKDLLAKKAELDTIIAETEKEEAAVQHKVETTEPHIDERLLTAYKRLRANAKNGLAVVTIARDSCSGCFNQIPPQKQMDIRQRKKIIVCEHCGRIIVDYSMVMEDEPVQAS